EHGIRLCHLARSSIAWKRSVGRSPDLASTPGTHVTKRPTRGPVPISGPSTPPGPGDTTPRIMEETGARSHTGPGDRGPGSGPTKKVTGSVDSLLSGNGWSTHVAPVSRERQFCRDHSQRSRMPFATWVTWIALLPAYIISDFASRASCSTRYSDM